MVTEKNSRILMKIDESEIEQNLKDLLNKLFIFELEHSDKLKHHFSKQYDKFLR